MLEPKEIKMPRGSPKKDLTELKEKLVTLVGELSMPQTGITDEELAQKLAVPVGTVKRAMKEVFKEGRVLRDLTTKKDDYGFTRERLLHVHRPHPRATGSLTKSPLPGFGRPVYNCVVCGERLPG